MTATVTEALFTAQSKLPLTLKRDAEAIGYRYMTLDQLIAATRPILNGHGLSITQWPTTVAGEDGGLRPALRTRITFDPDGSYVEDTMPLYLHEKSMQALGAAITYARRYAWAAALGIAAEEDTDSLFTALPHAPSCPIGTASSEGICTCSSSRPPDVPVWPGAGDDERDYSQETP